MQKWLLLSDEVYAALNLFCGMDVPVPILGDYSSVPYTMTEAITL